MTQVEPTIAEDRLYQLIRLRLIKEFNTQRAGFSSYDFSGMDFRGLDLRGIDADNIDFGNGYFRQADLRGLDLRSCNLEGASIHAAKISGVYFPEALSADEIMLSLTHGTRMRYR
jgi:uncharacterized protein YjbI with pentapeptide repeats